MVTQGNAGLVQKVRRMMDKPTRQPWLLHGHVLVIDDDEPYRRIVALRLGSAGCTCHTAATHDEGLRLLHTNPQISIAVLDYHMKGSEVASLVTKIRAMRPDVILVGDSSLDRRSAFASLGVDRFLKKPWTPDDLTELLRDHDAR